MELNKLYEGLVGLFDQIDFVYQLIEDGRFIAAHRQAQGAKARTQLLIAKVKEWQNELVKQANETKPECSEPSV